jgi:choline dehydrogenase-like flavoprotein
MYDVAIIGAGPAGATLARLIGDRYKVLLIEKRQLFPQKYVAIQEWVERKNDFPYFTSIFDRNITDYYCWTIPKGSYLLIGAALSYKRKAADKFAMLKAKLARYGMKFGKTVFKEGKLILYSIPF